MADEKKTAFPATKNTFAQDKRKPGTYLARIELAVADTAARWPLPGEQVTLVRKDGSEDKVTLGDKCVWSGPDGEKPGIEVALFTIAKGPDDKRRLPPGVKPPTAEK